MFNLQPIKDRLVLATPGPWKVSPSVRPKNVTAVAEVAHIFILAPAHPLRVSTVDANLIANAPADLAALVAEVERLREAIEAHQEKLTADSLHDLADRELWAVLDA